MTPVDSYFDRPFVSVNHATSQYLITSILLSSVKIISKSLNRKHGQFRSDRACVFIVDRYFV